MVVDDEVDIRELLADHLHGQGLIVTTMPDGQAAVDALERSNGRFGLVLTDINMPGADGFDVLRAARRANAAADVVVITGYASDGGAQKALGLGAHDYLHKPFKLGQLDTILSDRRRQRDAPELLEHGCSEPHVASRQPAQTAPSSVVVSPPAVDGSRDRGVDRPSHLAEMPSPMSVHDRHDVRGASRARRPCTSVTQSRTAACRRPGTVLAPLSNKQFSQTSISSWSVRANSDRR